MMVIALSSLKYIMMGHVDFNTTIADGGLPGRDCRLPVCIMSCKMKLCAMKQIRNIHSPKGAGLPVQWRLWFVRQVGCLTGAV
jgi:hypothetical protein